MSFLRAFHALAVATALAAAEAPPALVALTPAQMAAAILRLAEAIPFQQKLFSTKRIFEAIKADGANEDARPFLPSEFLALPEDQRARALHPDTTCLLVLMVARAAAQADPEAAASKDWMVPVLIRAQPVGHASSGGMRGTEWTLGGNAMTLTAGAGKVLGPSWPLLEFRRNLPDPDPRIGLDVTTRMVEPDRAARNFSMQHSGGIYKFAPELFFAPDEGGRKELENWVLARILVARAEGTWDPPAIRSRFLKLAAPRIPEWDTYLAARLTKAATALEGAPPAK